jgi:hypothetical protein
MIRIICLAVVIVQLAACATYERHSASYRPPKDYSNYINASGLMIGAEAFMDKNAAEKIFGFDIRNAGLLPVKLVADNKSGRSVDAVSGQTFLIDGSGRYWKMLSSREAVERVKKAAGAKPAAGGKGKETAWLTAAESLLKHAISVLSGRDAGAFVAKAGARDDASGSATAAAGKLPDDKQREARISEELREKGVDGKVLPSGSLATGFVYFPGEISSVDELRFQVRFRDTGKIQTLNLKLD